jgi:hypothetical protein
MHLPDLRMIGGHGVIRVGGQKFRGTSSHDV